MPLFRIHALRDSLRQQFRAVPHVSGCAAVKPKDYELRGQIEALHEYDAWRLLRASEQLEAEDGQLRICKYVGFEPAQWVVPEPRPQPEPEAAPTT